MNKRVRDISGREFGKWKVLKFLGVVKNSSRWMCRCTCGTEKSVSTNSLIRKVNPSRSCGCNRHDSAKDLTGKQFSRLLAIRDVGVTSLRKRVWLCQCACGVEIKVASNNLSSGNTRSCGCLKSESSSISGLANRGKRWADPYLNEQSFEELDESAAYWAGFLMADGYINRVKRGSADVALCLSFKDVDHVQKFKHFLNSRRKVTISRGKYPTAVFSVSSDALADRLTALGVTSHKTFTAKASALLIANSHFWRGAIDGDGCLSVAKKSEKAVSLSLVGSKDMCEQFLSYVRELGLGYNVSVRPHSHTRGIFNITLNGREAIRIADKLYTGSQLFLERKFTIFKVRFHPLLYWATSNKRGHIEWSMEARLKKSVQMKGNQLWRVRGKSHE